MFLGSGRVGTLSIVPLLEAVVGGLIERRFGALALVSIGLLSPPKRSVKPEVVVEGEYCARSGVLEPRVRFPLRVSIRDRADDCRSCSSWDKPGSYNLRVLVTLLSRAGVEQADVGAVDWDCQSLMDGVRPEPTDVAAVEFRARDGVEDVVDDVSRFRLYPGGIGDSERWNW